MSVVSICSYFSLLYSQDNILETRNNHRKNSYTAKYQQEVVLYPWNTYGKRLTKYPKEKTLDPQNTQKKNFWTHKSTMARWNKTSEVHNGTRPTEFTIVHKKYIFMNCRTCCFDWTKVWRKTKKELKRFNFLKLKPALSFKNNTTDT